MRALIVIGRKVIDLFVDDGSLAAVILGWIAFWALARASALIVPVQWGGVIFFLGLALILIENVLRTARRRRLDPPA